LSNPSGGGPKAPLRSSATPAPFPFLLAPAVWASRNRARRPQRGDATRSLLFGAIAAGVGAVLFAGAYWITCQLAGFAELGDYLLRLGLSWLFLTFLSFLAFSGVVTSLSTFFLSEDLRLLMAAPVASRRLFHARMTRTVFQASWMVVIFLAPVLAGVGAAKCAGPGYYASAVLTLVPFVVIPVALGAGLTLLLVNVFPARRAKDLLMLMGLVFAGALVMLLRFVQPERLLKVDSLPDISAFFATLQSPITPMLPSFWAGESLFAGLMGGTDLLHLAALWSTALGLIVVMRMAYGRWFFSGFSKAQEARKARFTKLTILGGIVGALPMAAPRRHLLIKDLKVFLRDVSQWSQLLLLLALVIVYLYNFRVLDLDRIPYMSGVIRNVYGFLNLGMAGFVMATVAVRFVFPAVSSEGAAFWVIRTSPVTLGDFLWSKFWTGLLPLLVLAEVLTITGNRFLGVDGFLQVVTAVAVIFISFALVGLATGLGARYPRFAAENINQVAGSYGGVSFMISAVLYIAAVIALVGYGSSQYLWAQARNRAMESHEATTLALSFGAAALLSVAIFVLSMRSGVKALEEMDQTPV
jgi:ABC-2 type transport system permease protein